MALEQSINLDSKSKGGIIGIISKKPGALERWFLMSHERTAITTALKKLCDLDDSESQILHKDCSDSRIKRDEEDINKLLLVLFTSEFMANPFVFEEQSDTDDKPVALSNFATGILAPKNVTDRLIAAKEIGQRHINDFIKEKLETSQKRFWDPFPQLKILTFASLTKTSKAKTEDKAGSISADRDLFGYLIIAAKSRAIDLKEVFSYELSSVPFALAHKDGSLRKSDRVY